MSETLSQLRLKPHLSNSSLRTYIDCSLRYRLSRIDHVQPEFRSSNLVLGSAIHLALERYYLAKQEEQNVTEPELVESLENYIRGTCLLSPPVHFKQGESEETLVEQGRSLVSTFLKDVPQEESRVIGVEVPFSINIPGVDEKIIGALDLLLEDSSGTLTILDHKTAAKTPSVKDVHGSDQLTLYQMAVKASGYQDREIVLGFNTLVKTKTPKLQIDFTSRTEEDEQRLIRKFQEVSRGIEAGIFIPNNNSWLCGSCEYQTACNAWGLSQAA